LTGDRPGSTLTVTVHVTGHGIVAGGEMTALNRRRFLAAGALAFALAGCASPRTASPGKLTL